MDLNAIWFLLIGVLLAGYAILDGFDLGVGVLHLFARSDAERRIHRASIGPVWDGNETWLVTAGGALFAAFPIVYATVFSGFYLAFMLLLVALIFRAVALEFHERVDAPRWRTFWDWAFGIGSLVPAILFGVAMGNVLRGLPITADGQLRIAFVSLLNPYALLMGVFTLVMFVMHGAAYLAARTEPGEFQSRMTRWTTALWWPFVALYLAATAATFFVSPFLMEAAASRPLGWAVLAVLAGAIVAIPLAARSGRRLLAFLASALAIASLVGLVGVSLYPRLVPSTVDLENSLTAHNASSTAPTLTAMLIVTLIGMPLVLGYTTLIYVVFMRKPVTAEETY
jgi:cytochrome d ubiquinol oxidase subunit II